MDDNTAQKLLDTIRCEKEKSAGYSWLDPWTYGGGSGFHASPATKARAAKLTGLSKAQAGKDRTSTIINGLLLAGGGAAALRGGIGLSRMFGGDSPVPSRTIDMPVSYPADEEEEKFAGWLSDLSPHPGHRDEEDLNSGASLDYDDRPGAETWMDAIPEDMRGDSWEEDRAAEIKEIQRMIESQARKTEKQSGATKEAETTVIDRILNGIGMGPKQDPQATSPYGVAGMLPALLLGTPLAAYAGWKGVDSIFNKQRKKKTENDLSEAKEQYEQALDSSSPVNCLDKAFDELEKSAGINPMDWFPNASGMGKGLAATYALLTAPAAYMYVNDKMKKTSKRSILEKAMKERARRRAKQQPAELYAIPAPQDKEEEEKDFS